MVVPPVVPDWKVGARKEPMIWSSMPASIENSTAAWTVDVSGPVVCTHVSVT